LRQRLSLPQQPVIEPVGQPDRELILDGVAHPQHCAAESFCQRPRDRGHRPQQVGLRWGSRAVVPLHRIRRDAEPGKRLVDGGCRRQTGRQGRELKPPARLSKQLCQLGRGDLVCAAVGSFLNQCSRQPMAGEVNDVPALALL
jgi:hypothetical protein